MSTDENSKLNALPPEKLEVEQQEQEQPSYATQEIQTQPEPSATSQQEEKPQASPEVSQQEQTPPSVLVPPAESYEEYFHDPWSYITAPTATSPDVSTSGQKNTDLPSGSPPPSPQRRFTHGRIVTFAALVLVVILAFGGGALALAKAVRPVAPVAPAQTTTQQQQQTTTMKQPPEQQRPTPMVPATPTRSATGQNMALLQDTFHRDQDKTGGWGPASDANGQAWRITNPPATAAFSVVNNVGHITANQTAAYYTAVLGPSFKDVDASATFTLPPFDERLTNIGVVVRWQDANNYDKAYLDGVQLVLLENRGGKQTTLQRVAFPALDDGNTAYSIRLRAVGTTFMAKAWTANKQEPTAWMARTSAAKLQSGQVGIRARLETGNAVEVWAFAAGTVA